MAVITDKDKHEELKITVGDRISRARTANGIAEDDAERFFLDAPKNNTELKKIVGRRIKISRKASDLTETDAARRVGYKKPTQISLAEKGERLPPLLTLIKLCDTYGITMDYACGRHNDPVADPAENRMGVMAHAISESMKGHYLKFVQSMSEHAAIVMAGQREDRIDLKLIVGIISEIEAAFNMLKLMNPEFDDEIRGGAKLENNIQKLISISEKIHARIEKERVLSQMLDRKVLMQDLGNNVKQFLLDLEIVN